MQLVLLEAKTAHGKNRLREAARAMPEWTGRWKVLQERDEIAAFVTKGPFVFVAPEGSMPRDIDRFSRWVALHDDKNFTVRYSAVGKPTPD